MDFVNRYLFWGLVDMRNELFLQEVINLLTIDASFEWQTGIISGRDIFGLYSEDPQVDTMMSQCDPYGWSPLSYYCLNATPEQLRILFRIIPPSRWALNDNFPGGRCIYGDVGLLIYGGRIRHDRCPLYLVALGGYLDTIKLMVQFLMEERVPRSQLIKNVGYLLLLSGHQSVVQWLLTSNDEVVKKFLQAADIFFGSDYHDHFNPFSQWSAELVRWAVSSGIVVKMHQNTKKLCDSDFRKGCSTLDNPELHLSRRIIDIACGGNFEVLKFTFSRESSESSNPIKQMFKNELFHNFRRQVAVSSWKVLFLENALENLSDELRQFFLMRDEDKNTFLHYLIMNGYGWYKQSLCHRDNVFNFIMQQPELAASMWDVANINGDTVNACRLRDRDGRIIASVTLLKEILRDALRRIVDDAPIAEVDLRLLRAFKEKVLMFLRYPEFIDHSTVSRLLNSNVLQTVYGESAKDLIIRIFKLRQLCERKALCSTLINDILSIFPAERTQKLPGFFRSQSTSIYTLLATLERVRDHLIYDESPRALQQAAMVLKLLLEDRKYEAALVADVDKHALCIVRNILLGTDEISALSPRPVESAGHEIPESNFEAKLTDVERDLERVLSGDDAISALRVLNGIRYLMPNFDLLNAFAKAHPEKLYYLDTPEKNLIDPELQDGKLPFHLHEYGTDDVLRTTLLRIVREYLAAFDLSKSAGKSKEFFQKTITGFCLDIRVRDLVTWVAQFNVVENSDTLDTLMGKYIAEYEASLHILDGVINGPEIIPDAQDALTFILRYHAGERYKVDGGSQVIDEAVIKKYLIEVLDYDVRQEKRCVVS
jgi:hypothetical protein